jgi:hypothetical protein
VNRQRWFSSLALGLLSIFLVWLALTLFGYVALTRSAASRLIGRIGRAVC